MANLTQTFPDLEIFTVFDVKLSTLFAYCRIFLYSFPGLKKLNRSQMACGITFLLDLKLL